MDAMALLIFLLPALSSPALAAGRDFHFVNLQKNWADAQSYCREKFIDLATLESAGDMSKVAGMVASSGSQDVWIGLYEEVNSWKWTLDNSDFNANNYGAGFSFVVDGYIVGESCGDLMSGEFYETPCEELARSLCYDETSNSYIEVTEGKSWKSAQSFCRATYTDLANIRNQQELDDVMSVADFNEIYWIGLFREGWKWSDRSNSTFRQWGPGEPGGDTETCGAAAVDGCYDLTCDTKLPFICSAPVQHSKVLKVTLKTDGSLNLNDPLVQEAIRKKMEEALRGQGVHQEFSLRWKKQPHGDVFNKTH